jgi:hypothetical protein
MSSITTWRRALALGVGGLWAACWMFFALASSVDEVIAQGRALRPGSRGDHAGASGQRRGRAIPGQFHKLRKVRDSRGIPGERSFGKVADRGLDFGMPNLSSFTASAFPLHMTLHSVCREVIPIVSRTRLEGDVPTERLNEKRNSRLRLIC